MPFGPKAVATALAAVSHAGPPASPMGAAAVVARLRKSVVWSNSATTT